jgi:hypothetical protein
MKLIRTTAGIINLEAISHLWDLGDELLIFMIGSPHSALKIEGKAEVREFLRLVPCNLCTSFKESTNQSVEIAGIKEPM